jgi:hypothetical protein
MHKRKVKPNTFEDRAIAKVHLEGKIDLKELWKAEEDKELDPAKVEGLAKG